MSSWSVMMTAFENISLPLLGLIVLGMSKLTTGETARIAEQWFIGVLLAITVITCRTVIVHDECWLAHTATLGLMVVGALLFPNRESLSQRRVAAATAPQY